MRIWDIPVNKLCRRHLLGEHRELHCIWEILTCGYKRGYMNHPETLRWKGQLPRLSQRHGQQADEMERRGYHHHSPLPLHWPSEFKNDLYETKGRLRKIHSIPEQKKILQLKGCECNV